MSTEALRAEIEAVRLLADDEQFVGAQKLADLAEEFLDGAERGRYVAVNVGCLECGYETTYHGSFPDIDAAREAVLREHEEKGWEVWDGEFTVIGHDHEPSQYAWRGQALWVLIDTGGREEGT